MADHEADRERLGFIGMGAMGSRMAGRLLAAGRDLTVFNRTAGRTRPLADRGAKVASTPGELAAAADVVLTSLADDAAVMEVMLGADGALAAAGKGTIFLEMSTVSPGTSRRLHEEAARRDVRFLDAPVSGSTPHAERGELVVFAGGEEAVFEACRPIVAELGKAFFYMGPAGMGAAMKLCVNALLGLGVQALAEAVALGRRSGLEHGRLLQVLGETAVLSPAQKAKLENARRGDYPTTFPLHLMYKDFGLILQQAHEVSAPMPATAAAAQLFAAENSRRRQGGADEDFSAIIRTLLRLAGEA